MGNLPYQIKNKHILELNEKIENIIKNKSDSYIDQIANEFASFLMSDNFIDHCYFFLNGKYEDFFILLEMICEINEKSLFIKSIFPLLEKLITLKFESQLAKLNNYHPKQIKEDFLIENTFENKTQKIILEKMCKIIPYLHAFFLVSVVALFEKMDSFNEKIKKDINISIAFLFYTLGLNVKFESLIKNKSGSYIELYINELAHFLMSEEFLNICYFF